MKIKQRIPVEIVSVQENKYFTVKEESQNPEPVLVAEAWSKRNYRDF